MKPPDLIRACLATLEREGMTPLGIVVPLCSVGLAEPDYCVAIVHGPAEGETRVVTVDEKDGCGHVMSGDDVTMQWGDFLLATVLGGTPNDFDLTQR